MVKHELEDRFSTPTKRRRCTFSAPMSAPCLPARPCDSPSNPFGRKRVQSLARSLPPPTPFSKHLPLRFQLVRSDRPCPRRNGGVHRIVQVPTNYTFVHLRCLIAFLFGGCYSMLLRQEPHLFEVKRKIELFGMDYKPGQVKSGQTWAKLSSTMDPCRYRPDGKSTECGGASVIAPKDEILGHGEEEEPGDWKWHAEEDYTLERAWPKGCDLTRAIIYHHDRGTQIHITVNTLTVEKRKGHSNIPYVFCGRGLVSLSLPSLISQPDFAKRQPEKAAANRHSRSLRRASLSSSPLKSKSRAQISDQEQDLTDQDAEGELDDGSDSDVSQQEHEPDNIHAVLDNEIFNEDAFPRFFSRCQRVSRSRPQYGSSFGLEYDSSSSEDEQACDRRSASSSAFHDSSSPVKPPADYSSPATSTFSSVPPATKSHKARDGATPPPQTSSPGPSSPASVVAFFKPSIHRRSSHSIPSSPGNLFDSGINLSADKRNKRRRSSLLHHLPFHPSPSGFPKYTPFPARGELYKMRMTRIEKRVERMKSLEFLRVPDEDEDGAKVKKKEEKKAGGKGKEKAKGERSQMPERRAAPGGVLEMGISRGKRVLLREKPGPSRRTQHTYDDDEQEV